MTELNRGLTSAKPHSFSVLRFFGPSAHSGDQRAARPFVGVWRHRRNRHGEGCGVDRIVRDETDARLPKAAHFALAESANQIEALTRQIEKLEREIVAEAKRDEDMRRLITIPGVGAITAASIKALVPDPDGFKSGRHFAAWLGLTPKPHSSGGKERWAGYRKWAIQCSAPCSSSARPLSCGARGNANAPQWLSPFWSDVPSRSSPLRSPIR